MRNRKITIVTVSLIVCVIISTACKKETSTREKHWEVLFGNINDTSLWMNVEKGYFPKEGWEVKGNELALTQGRKGGHLITRRMYSDFELELEFKMTRLVNSGVKYFLNQMTNDSTLKTEWIGFEYQIIDDFHYDEISGYEGDKGSTGALYLIYAPASNKQLKPIGEWNSIKIVVNGYHIEHWLNGKKVVSEDINSTRFKKLVQHTKFKHYQDFGKMSEGYIQLQAHSNEIKFKNIRIREITK